MTSFTIIGKKSIAAIGVAAAASMFGVGVSQADVFDNWMKFGSSNSAGEWDQPYDRTVARQWEINPPKGYPTIAKANITFMKAAIKRYARIVSKGGWRPLPRGKRLSTGMSGDSVARLRKHLLLTGDLRGSSGFSSVYDYYVEQAVKRFQKRHGLTPSGQVDKSTLMALNVPASARLRQLRTNLSRVAALSRKRAKKFVMVNIPAAQLEAVENGKLFSRHSVVVGKPGRATPVLTTAVSRISFNPYWTVPPTVLREDLIPKARQYAKRGKDVLAAYRMTAFYKGRKLNPRTINWNSPAVYKYTYRQEPYEDNSMGFVKIFIPNKHMVFLHDTPLKTLFGRNFRAASSGCVRVQNVTRFVSWLLKDNKGWNLKRVAGMKRSGERLEVRPKKNVPVYLAYITAWATPDSTVNFRRDIYRRDGVGLTASAY